MEKQLNLDLVFAFYGKLLRQISLWLKRVTLWFVVSLVAGVFFYFISPGQIDFIMGMYGDIIGAEFTPGLELTARIFVQNLTAVALALVGGIILGILPTFIIIFNGLVIGYVVTFAVAGFDDIFTGIFFVLLATLPHGIIEIPAVLIATALGIMLGTHFLRREYHGRRKEVFKRDLRLAFHLLPLIVFLLLVAAVIEGFFTASLVM